MTHIKTARWSVIAFGPNGDMAGADVCDDHKAKIEARRDSPEANPNVDLSILPLGRGDLDCTVCSPSSRIINRRRKQNFTAKGRRRKR